jgi:glutaredoxin
VSIETSNPDTITTAANAVTLPTVTVFSKNKCSRCDAVEAKFIKAGVPFREINVETDAKPRAEFGNKTAFEHVVERYGREMPVVVVENGVWDDHWSGLRPDKVLELIALFEKQGATIPAEERAAHMTHL